MKKRGRRKDCSYKLYEFSSAAINWEESIPLGIPSPSTSLKCLYTNACSMRIKQEALEICMRSQNMILLWSWRHGRTACITGMLSWMAIHFLGKSCQWGNAAELLFMSIKLHLRVRDDPEKSLLVRIRRQPVICESRTCATSFLFVDYSEDLFESGRTAEQFIKQTDKL